MILGNNSLPFRIISYNNAIVMTKTVVMIQANELLGLPLNNACEPDLQVKLRKLVAVKLALQGTLSAP